MTHPHPPDLIVLDPADNVATALRDNAAGASARVAGADGPLPELALPAAIPLGHKAAIRAIAQGEFVVKHGHPIGRATQTIGLGEHVHVHNAISLSRETDLAPDAQAAADQEANHG